MATFDFEVRTPADTGTVLKSGELEHAETFRSMMDGGEPELTAFFHDLPEIVDVPAGQQIGASVTNRADPPALVWSTVWDKE